MTVYMVKTDVMLVYYKKDDRKCQWTSSRWHIICLVHIKRIVYMVNYDVMLVYFKEYKRMCHII